MLETRGGGGEALGDEASASDVVDVVDAGEGAESAVSTWRCGDAARCMAPMVAIAIEIGGRDRDVGIEPLEEPIERFGDRDRPRTRLRRDHAWASGAPKPQSWITRGVAERDRRWVALHARLLARTMSVHHSTRVRPASRFHDDHASHDRDTSDAHTKSMITTVSTSERRRVPSHLPHGLTVHSGGREPGSTPRFAL